MVEHPRDEPHVEGRTTVTTTVCCPVCRAPIDGPGQPIADGTTRVCRTCWPVLIRYLRRLPRTVCT
jgi:hypothetical protein